MQGSFDIDDRVLGEAADWYARLRADGADATTRQAFASWQAADPAHRLAYAEVCALGWALPNAASEAAQVAATPSHAAGRRPTLAVRARARAASRLLAWAMGAAASLLLALLVPRLGEPLGAALSDHAAPRAAREVVTLVDGSVVELEALSRLDVTMAATSRRLTLASGALFVDVASDPTRPLTVEADGVAVTAIGTRFGVRISGDSVQVAVEEGRVAVDHDGRRLELGAGQQWRVGSAAAPTALDGSSLAWRSGRLAFSGEPLGEVLATLARHTPEPVWGLDRVAAEPAISLSVPSAEAQIALEELLAERGHRLVRVPVLGFVVR